MFGLVTVLALCAAPPDLSPRADTIQREVRVQEAMKWMREVYSTDRWFTFPKFQETADHLARTLRQIGLERVEVIAAPADGKSQFGFWTMPMAWDARSATLEIIGPQPLVLADFRKIPASLGMWSGSTPPEGVVADVIEVTKPEEIVKIDVRGKMVLLSRNPANYKFELVKAGALGAINAFTENPELVNGRQWINAWGDKGWAFNKGDTPLLSFSISPREAELLRARLKAGRVQVRAKAETRYYEGSYPYVTAVIPGAEPQEEVLTLGHTAEQGAQDNATGVAAMLESVAALTRLIRAGKLPRPKRSIRIMLMGEMYASHHYIASNADRVRRTVAAMCLDTPASPYELKGTEYTFYMNPHSGAAYTDALIKEIARVWFPRVKRPWHWKPFMPGTDSYLGEPSVGIPTTWAYSGTGVETHHNSEDTPDRVDSRSLRDITIVNAMFLYTMAEAGESHAPWLAELAAKDWTGASDYHRERSNQAVLSVLRLVPEAKRDAVRKQLEPLLKPVARTAPGSGFIVKRKRFGTIPLDDLAMDQREGFPSGAWSLSPSIALYWCDGKRPLSEVIRLTEAELGGKQKLDFEAYFRFLARRGYVEILEPGAALPGRYFPLLEAGAAKAEARLNEKQAGGLAEIESGQSWRHFPYAILAPAVLYAKKHPANPHAGSAKYRDLAIRIGDFLSSESEKGKYEPRGDSDWDDYMWLEAYRLLGDSLGDERRARWRREISKNIALLVEDARDRLDFPWYNSPYIGTSPNHYALWAANLYLGGRLFGNREWEELGARILRRYALTEQTADGYWGEHSRNGPTIGYNHLTVSALAVYYEHSGDRDVLPALRRATDLHRHFTFLDGSSVDVINDRNRRWGPSAWSQFAFTHFPEGRGFAEFLSRFFDAETLTVDAAGRLAQDALYYHEGPAEPAPQDLASYVRRMEVPASVRKSGPWQVALSGLIDTQAINSRFYLDRQGHISVFHQDKGLIITGANSKRQPELATFTETSAGQLVHMPLSSRLQMGDREDRLSLAYNTFFSDIYVAADRALSLRFVISGRGTPGPDTRLNLQLGLKSGEVLETGSGKRVTLGPERIELSPADLSGRISHHGWSLEVPETATLVWPVYPHNPYSDSPETNIAYAVGRLSVPLELKSRKGKYVRANEMVKGFRLTIPE